MNSKAKTAEGLLLQRLCKMLSNYGKDISHEECPWESCGFLWRHFPPKNLKDDIMLSGSWANLDIDHPAYDDSRDCDFCRIAAECDGPYDGWRIVLIELGCGSIKDACKVAIRVLLSCSFMEAFLGEVRINECPDEVDAIGWNEGLIKECQSCSLRFLTKSDEKAMECWYKHFLDNVENTIRLHDLCHSL